MTTETISETLTFIEPMELAASSDPGRRLITGLVIPFDSYGMTSAGKVKIPRDAAIRLPADLTRVKLLTRHSDDQRAPAVSVGSGLSARFVPAGLEMTFRVAAGPDGDRLLAEAADHTNDGLSVEMVRVQSHADQVTAGDLTAVAVVPIPAFEDARITSVAAADHEPALTAATSTHEHDNTEETPAMTEPTPIPDPVTPDPVTPDPATTPDPQPQPDPVPDPETGETVTAAAAVPMFQGSGSTRRAPGAQLDRLYAAVAAVNSGHMSPELTAALADITYSAGPFAAQPEYVGQLWSGVGYQRKFVPLLNQKPLTSLKVKGWFWVTAPEVADYAGDKAAIPSNAVEVDDREVTATRLAGGHDIDRAYYDFGDTEFIAAYYAKMAESYAKKSDAKALADIIAAAGAASATIGADLLEAVAIGVDEIDDATGATATFAIVNNVDRRGLLNIAGNDVPAYLKEILKIDPMNFVASSVVPAGTVYVGVRNAMDHRELPGSPIRVSAVNVPNGGIDDAVFGYRATMLQDADGLATVTFA
jgi:hypothetical protein